MIKISDVFRAFTELCHCTGIVGFRLFQCEFLKNRAVGCCISSDLEYVRSHRFSLKISLSVVPPLRVLNASVRLANQQLPQRNAGLIIVHSSQLIFFLRFVQLIQLLTLTIDRGRQRNDQCVAQADGRRAFLRSHVLEDDAESPVVPKSLSRDSFRSRTHHVDEEALSDRFRARS